MLQEQETPAGAQHAMRLGQSPPVIRDRAERKGDDHRIEALVRELQRLRVADEEIGLVSEIDRSLAGDLQHGRADVDAGQRGTCGVVRQVAPGAHTDLQDLALDPRAHPRATAAEQNALVERDVGVVLRRELVPAPPDTFGLAHLPFYPTRSQVAPAFVERQTSSRSVTM